MRFVLIDESVVDRGFWAMVEGIDLNLFKKNPLMLFMHQRANGWHGKKEQVLPIGHWKDVKLETIDGLKSITATPVFDEKDDFAMKIKDKVEGNHLRMASAGLKPITWSDDKNHLKKGQTRATLLKSEMYEASIVDIGSNRNAIRLYTDEKGTINLADENQQEAIIPTLNLNEHTDMKAIALKLGLPENATEAEVLAAIGKLINSEKEAKETAENLQSERVNELLKSEAVTDENKESIEKLAKVDYQLAQQTVKALEGKKETPDNKGEEGIRLSDAIQKRTIQKGEESKEKSWDDISDEDKVKLRNENPEEYIKLYEANYGYKPEIN